jgi:hypothetical protein
MIRSVRTGHAGLPYDNEQEGRRAGVSSFSDKAFPFTEYLHKAQDRIITVVPLAQSSGDYTIQAFSSESSKGLTLILSAGSYPNDGVKQSLKLVMKCAKETQAPKLTGYDGSQAAIEWDVVEACGSSNADDPPKTGDDSAPSNDDAGGSSMGWFFFM